MRKDCYGRERTNYSFCIYTHNGILVNPLLAESLYLARYIERVGSGTQTMIELCREAGLPEPLFEQRKGFFVTTIWRDWLTPEILAGMNLNERQVKAVAHIKGSGRITNSEFQELRGCARKTAARDLDDLVQKSVIVRVGEKRGSYYILTGKK